MLVSSSFSKTFSAVYRSASARLEWNFTFFATLCTGCFVHLAVLSIRQVAYTSTILYKEPVFFWNSNSYVLKQIICLLITVC